MSAESTREKLLTAATELFHQNGYAAVSLQRIAESVGLKQGNVYYHFRTKRSLGLAVLEQWAEANRLGLASLERKGAARKKILAFLDWTSEQEQAYFSYGCPIANLTDELLAESNEETRAEVTLVHDESISWLRERFAEIGLESTRCDNAARFVLCLTQGTIRQCRVTGNRKSLSAAKNELKTWLNSITPSLAT